MSDTNKQLPPGETLFWDLARPMLFKGLAEEGSMMGFKCLRCEGKFFASLDRQSKSLIVKLPAERVLSLIAQGSALPFAPNGRTFKEWAMIPEIDESVWRDLLQEAHEFVSPK